MKEDAQVIGALEGLVLYTAHRKDTAGAALVKKYGVWGYPSFLVLNADHEMIDMWVGYGDAEEWSRKLVAVRADPVAVREREVRFASQPNYADAISLGQVALAESRMKDAGGFFHQAMELDPAAATEADVPIKLFNAVYFGHGRGEFTFDEVADVVTEILQIEDIPTEHVIRIAERLVRAIPNAGVEAVTPLLMEAKGLLDQRDDQEFADRHSRFEISYALHVEQDAAKALELKRATLAEGWRSDPAGLNDFAWWCFTADTNLEEAEQLARKAMELAKPGPEQANCLDTLAELVNARGETAEAIALIQRALELEPDNEYLKLQLEKFQGGGSAS